MDLFAGDELGTLLLEEELPMGQLTEADFFDEAPHPGLIGSFAKTLGCGAPECRNGWMTPWRRRRPMFEGHWRCSSNCLESMVRAAVRREAGDGAATALEERHRHRVPLGLVLLAQGWITHPQLQAALAAQRQSGRGRIGDWLSESCGLEQDRITRGLGVQWACPVLSTEGFSAAAMALVMPQLFVREFGLLPLGFAGSPGLRAAFADRMDAALVAALEQMTGLKVETGLLSAKDFAAAQKQMLAAEAVPVTLGMVDDAEVLTASISKLIEQAQPTAARLVRVHQYFWLRLWMEDGGGHGGTVPKAPTGVEDHIFRVGRDSDAD